MLLLARLRWRCARAVDSRIADARRGSGSGAEGGERGLQQLELTARIAERGRGVGGSGEEGDAIRARQPLGIRNAMPQLERALEQRRRLAVGIRAGGGRRGAHRGGQRRRLVTGGGEVVGDGGRGLRAGAVVEALIERARERQVQLRALAGEQVLGDHLAQEGMAEPIRAVVPDDQDVTLDGLAQRVAERPRLQAARLLQQRMIELLADRDEPQQLLRGPGQPFGAQHERVAQRVRRRAAPVEPGGQQLLAEQRVAAGSRPQPLQQLGGRRGPEDVGQLLGQLVAGQRRERDPARAGMAFELGEQRAQRVAAVQLVGPVGGGDQDPLAGQVAREKCERRARRAVGPVQILDDQQHRPLAARARRAATAGPRTAAPGCPRRAAGYRAWGAQPRQQRRDGVAHRLGERRVAAARERPQRRDQRQVGQLALTAEVDRLAGQHERPAIARAAHELRQQPRLPDARLAGHERHRGAPVGGVGQRRLELGQLGAAADEPGAGDARAHVAPRWIARTVATVSASAAVLSSR